MYLGYPFLATPHAPLLRPVSAAFWDDDESCRLDPVQICLANCSYSDFLVCDHVIFRRQHFTAFLPPCNSHILSPHLSVFPWALLWEN